MECLKLRSSLQSNDECSEIKRIKISIETSAQEIRSNCMKLVTVHGRPFSLMGDEAFRNIINPSINALSAKGDGNLTISPTTIRDDVMLEAEQIRTQIKSALKEVNIYFCKCELF